MRRLCFARLVAALAIVLVFFGSSAPIVSSQSAYTTVNVGDNPEPTLVDPIRNLIYVICTYDDTIHVINANTNAVVRTLSPGYQISAAILDPVANRLYVSSCRPVHVLDAATGMEVGTIEECVQQSEHFAIDPGRHRLVIADRSGLIGLSDYVNIYDTNNLQRIARIEIGYDPSFRYLSVGVNTSTGMGYCTYDIPPSVTYFDVSDGTIRHRVEEDIDAYHGIAVDSVRNRIYVRCSANTTVLDGTTGARVGTIPKTGLPAVNSVRGRVYVWRNTELYVFDAGTLSEVGSVRIPGVGYAGYYATMGVLENMGRVYCPMTYDDKLAVIDDQDQGPTPTTGPPTATPSRTATPTRTHTAMPTPTATRTSTPGPTLTPTATRPLGDLRMHVPLVHKHVPTPTPTVPWSGRPKDGAWSGQTTANGHPTHPQPMSFRTINGGSKIQAGMDLRTYVYESGTWTCSGTADWEISNGLPIGSDSTFTFSRSYINGSITGTGRFVSAGRAEGTFETYITYGVCGQIQNTGTWWANWQSVTSYAGDVVTKGDRLQMRVE